jgi:hypothetical protein
MEAIFMDLEAMASDIFLGFRWQIINDQIRPPEDLDHGNLLD